MTECAIQQDLCPFYRGDTIPFEFTFKQPDDTPLDITDMTLTFSMKEDPDDELPVLSVSTTFPDDADSHNGKGSLKIQSSDTIDLEPDINYYFDFQLENGSEIFTVGAGRVKVLYDITTE
jgi:hypothetical protein